jgi:phenylalanyl-tRNA synthetase alpha chain
MNYNNQKIGEVAELLKSRFADLQVKTDILRSPELKSLYSQIASTPENERASFGQEVNQLRSELEGLVEAARDEEEKPTPIDITAPFDINVASSKRPKLLNSLYGSEHPLMKELDNVLDIFYRMGFSVVESRQIDDDYHMFETLNFPVDHPARDQYDTFMTTDGLIAPAHTSTMQNRVLKANIGLLEQGRPIAVVIPGRVFRNEDLDARHEHTFYQLEGIYVDKNVNAGNLIATLKSFLQEYYKQELEVKTQPFYFPFTEPSFEFALSCPFCKKAGCSVCSYSGWIELIGCGMIHPNVLKMAGIDPTIYSGFAWGGGIDRLVMMKYDIDDVRYFESGRLDFLRQFL